VNGTTHRLSTFGLAPALQSTNIISFMNELTYQGGEVWGPGTVGSWRGCRGRAPAALLAFSRRRTGRGNWIQRSRPPERNRLRVASEWQFRRGDRIRPVIASPDDIGQFALIQVACFNRQYLVAASFQAADVAAGQVTSGTAGLRAGSAPEVCEPAEPGCTGREAEPCVQAVRPRAAERTAAAHRAAHSAAAWC
jgi:hypothetical protein